MPANKTRKIDPRRPQPEIIKEAGQIIDRGGLVVFPTRCLYGLAADMYDAQAVQSVFRIKQRDAGKPLSVLIKAQDQLNLLVQDILPAAIRLMNHFWPGNITLIFKARKTVPDPITAHTGKIGIRLPGYSVARALTVAAKHPITATSANLAGNSGCFALTHLDPPIQAGANLILDAGPLDGGLGSTVIDVTFITPQILREGTVSSKDIFETLSTS
jgi:L-threonylcarbamoyladenylate synthase